MTPANVRLAAALMDDLPQQVVAVDRHWRVRYVNRAHARVLGCAPEWLLGAEWNEALPDMHDGPLPRHARHVMQRGAPTTLSCFVPATGRAMRIDLAPSDDGVLVSLTDEHDQEGQDGSELERSRTLQMAVAEFGLYAMRAPDLRRLKQEATERVRTLLDADFCKVLKLLPGGHELLLEAGVGWREGLVGRGTVGSDLDSQAGFTLRSQGPVLVEDLRTESRFRGPALLREHHVVSGMSVIIHGSREPHGVLGVHTRRERTFTRHEVHFIQAVANILAEAIRHQEQERRAHALAERLTTTLESITDGFYTLDEDWRFTYVNAAAEAVFRRKRQDMLGQCIWQLFPELQGTELEGALRRAVAEDTPVRTEARAAFRDAWLHINAYPSGEGLAVYVQDNTERRAHQQRLELHRRFHVSLSQLTRAGLEGQLDASFFQRALDDAVSTLPGAQTGYLLQRNGPGAWRVRAATDGGGSADPAFDVTDDAHVPASAEVHRAATGAPPPDALYRALCRARSEAAAMRATMVLPIHVTGEVRAILYLGNREMEEAFSDDTLELGRLLARQLGSVIHRMDLEHHLARQARTDPVVDIPNRRHAEELLAEWLDRNDSAALLFLDLDDFKHVNTNYGHDFGDSLLQEVARRTRRCLGDADYLARWGGDEFLILLHGISDAEDAAARARTIERALARPFHIGPHAVYTSTSIGVALLAGRSRAAGRILREADIALHRAKHAGKNRTILFIDDMGTETKRRFALEAGLRAALHGSENQLHLAFQPRIDLASGETLGAEALARWTHPTLGDVPPSEFIPIAEATGLIHPLTDWAVEEACRHARLWLDAGRPHAIAVNLSAKSLRNTDIVVTVRDALLRYRLDPAHLELEITETTAVAALSDATNVLQRLRNLGVTIAIDDFGTAYASLAHLKRLPIDTLKIDRTFIHDLTYGGSEASGKQIVEAIVTLGHAVGLSVIAEGLETRAQVSFLRHVGCDAGQGHFFGAPGPAPLLLSQE